MAVFRLFLRDQTRAFVLTAITFIGVEAWFGGVYVYHEWSYRSRVDFYQSFLHHEEGSIFSNAKRSIVSIITQDSGHHELDRVKLLFSIWAMKDQTKVTQLFAESPETALALLSGDKKEITALLREPNEKIAALSFNGRWGLQVAYFSFAFLSTLCLWLRFAFWGQGSVVYFPFRSWWFYCYLILFLPGALLLGILVGATMLIILLASVFHRIDLRRFLARWQRTHADTVPSYEDICASIQKRLPETKRAWVDLFSASRIEALRRSQENAVLLLKADIERGAKHLQDLQTAYFHAKKCSSEFSVDDEVRERVSKELDALVALPTIRGVLMENGVIEIYTDYLRHMSIEKVGPYRIVVKTTETSPEGLPRFSLESIYNAHATSNSGRSRNNRRDFCFGNVGELIRAHLADYRLCDATILMINSFQHG